MIKKLLFLLCLPLTVFAQHTMKGNFAVEDSYKFGILYRIAPDNVFYVADSNVAADGTFEIPLKEDLNPGMYRLVYNLPQDKHFFDFIYNGKEDIEFNFSKEKSVTFNTSEENKIWTEYKGVTFQFENQLSALLSDPETKTSKIKKALKDHAKWHNTLAQNAKGLLVETYIDATKPYFVKDIKSIKAYTLQAKKAYLDQLDFTNKNLQNSGIPLEQAIKYIYNFTDQDNPLASHQYNIDDIATALETTNKGYQKSVLYSVYNFLTASNQIDEANYLAERYVIPLAKTLNDNALAEQLTVFINTSIGAKAPNFTWPEYEGDKTFVKSLYELNEAQQYVLVFWSSLCSHCLKEVPVLHDKTLSMEKGVVKVIAIGLEDFEAEWTPKASQFTNFINVLGLKKWENEIGNKYDVTATPTYFVLDKDKNITQKPETLEELLTILEGQEKEKIEQKE